MSLSWEMDDPAVVHPHSESYLAIKRNTLSDTPQKHEFQMHYSLLKKLDSKGYICDGSIYMTFSKHKSIVT